MKMKGSQIDSIIGRVVLSVKGDTYKTMLLEIFSPYIKLQGARGEGYVFHPGDTFSKSLA
jgi:hypothetical protein